MNWKTISTQAALSLVVLGLASASAAQPTSKTTATVTAETRTPEPGTASGPFGESEYRLGPEDQIQFFVWKEPDLTLDVTVRPDGMITVPLLGDVAASGRTPASLAGILAADLQRLIESPRVTVSVSQATSARVYVIGQMVRPGEFALLGRMTVLKALALAGGFKDFAKSDSIVIVREDQSVIPFNYKRVTDGRDVSQNVLLAAGDTIVVP